ncbi:MAG: hypothetical protein ACTS44_01250 [Candidatus Hodgkinia cicadicola]
MKDDIISGTGINEVDGNGHSEDEGRKGLRNGIHFVVNNLRSFRNEMGNLRFVSTAA